MNYEFRVLLTVTFQIYFSAQEKTRNITSASHGHSQVKQHTPLCGKQHLEAAAAGAAERSESMNNGGAPLSLPGFL